MRGIHGGARVSCSVADAKPPSWRTLSIGLLRDTSVRRRVDPMQEQRVAAAERGTHGDQCGIEALAHLRRRVNIVA